jgi:hypothetical protein
VKEAKSKLTGYEIEKATNALVAFSIFGAYRTERPEAVSGVARASRGDLHLDHFLSLWTFGALRHFEFNFLALFEGLEAVSLNGAIVNKNV